MLCSSKKLDFTFFKQKNEKTVSKKKKMFDLLNENMHKKRVEKRLV